MSAEPVTQQGEARARVANRYAVHRVLGKGGAAIVYDVTDSVTQQRLALKQLYSNPTDRDHAEVVALFEREFHTLVQLSHPSVIAVDAYGVDECGPYYTMELLDGADLNTISPLPWREACSLMFDVCSSLALLHSRGLVHRDISPRNVRKTAHGAKLLDFGAMVPMGPCRKVVGTPPFAAPEVVHRGTLDARTDLFSLGTTLYSALAGRLAYPARKFGELPAAWATQPQPPSSCVRDIPPGLDALVLSLISVDPASRPRNAGEVMQRLAAVADIDRVEPSGVSRAYLATPVLVARERAQGGLRKRLIRAQRGRGGAAVITGVAGVGRSRLLDTCALDAAIMGATVLRGAATATSAHRFALAQSLIEQLVEQVPDAALAAAQSMPHVARLVLATEPGAALTRVADLSSSSAELHELQSALHAWLLATSTRVRLVLAVDDLQHADAASAGLLAGLAQASAASSMFVIGTATTDVTPSTGVAYELLQKHSVEVAIAPLRLPAMQSLLTSVFGDVPHLASIGEALYKLSGGLPRECMVLAQHLVASGVIEYANGSWKLPAVVEAGSLPSSFEQALVERIAALDPFARRLVECHALEGSMLLERRDYAALGRPEDDAALDAALETLLAQRVLARDGTGYVLAHGGWQAVLTARLPVTRLADHHRALARMGELGGKHPLSIVEHLLAGGAIAEALDRLSVFTAKAESQGTLILTEGMASSRIAELFERALEHAERSGRRPRELATLRRFLTLISVAADDRYYRRAAGEWLRELTRDSGLDAWRALDPSLPAQERLSLALSGAIAAYEATPEHDRVYRFDEAIRHLVYFVGFSIAVGSRTWDEALIESLHELLEPFAPLSPLAHAIWQNALAARESLVRGQHERARARWTQVIEHLAALPDSGDQYVQVVRKAIAFGLGTLEAKLGIASAQRWLDLVDGDPLQGVGALHVHRVLRLQQGDREGAESYRRQAELLAAQINVRPLMNASITVELGAQALASDLTGVKQSLDRIAPLAERHPGWRSFLHLAAGQYQRLRGDLDAAVQELERGLACCAPEGAIGTRSIAAWIAITAELVGTLTGADRAQEAKQRGLAALELCARIEVDVAADPIRRALALAEGKLGEHAAATGRLQALIESQQALGVEGLTLGASYEAGARLAVMSGDAESFSHYAQAAAREYRHDEGSALAVHYERLMVEARSAGLTAAARPGDLTGVSTTTTFGRRTNHRAQVAKALREVATRDERANAALRLLCEAKGGSIGYLLLGRGGGLVLAATIGCAAAPAGMVDHARDYLDAEIERDESVTAVGTADEAEPVLTSGWTDAEGQAYRSVPLTAELDGEVVFAGIALIQIGGRMLDQTGVNLLVRAIAQALLAAGDAEPLARRSMSRDTGSQ